MKWAEVQIFFDAVNAAFREKNESKIKALIAKFLMRLDEEVTTSYSDRDLMLLEIRANLKRYLQETDLSTQESVLFFEEEVVDPFIRDLVETGVKRLVGLAEMLARLKWK